MNANDVYKIILKYGFFPDRLRGILSSENFGDWVLKNESTIESLQKNKIFKVQNYKSTRNNNAPRYFGMIHPEAYARLAHSIKDNWDKINERIYKVDDYENISMIRARTDNKDRRLFSMASYDLPENKESLLLSKQAGSKVLVKADIANFFPSVYTHSITWALVGKEIAKDRSNQSCDKWFNELDCISRILQDKETLGLPIGSDTSNLIAELIASQIDTKLSSKYKYIRHIDDYTCYCADSREAESFIAELVRELEIYRLKLNTKKTRIINLPSTLNDSWVRSLRQLSKWKEVDKYNKNNVIDFLDCASDLFRQNPTESPIRYAIKVLSKKKFIDYPSYMLVLQYILNLCTFYPYIIDTLGNFIEIGLSSFSVRKISIVEVVAKSLNLIIKEHIEFARSDAIVWSFAYAILFNIELLSIDRVKKIALEQEDYTILLSLYLYCKKNNLDFDFIEVSKLEAVSEAWLLEYEYRRIENLEFTEHSFLESLRKDQISFIDKRILEKFE